MPVDPHPSQDLAKQLKLLIVLIKENSWIQTSQTGGHPSHYMFIDK